MINEYSKIKKWYTKNYQSDNIGKNIKSNITFCDLFIALEIHKDIYKFLGVNDSIIRENIFVKLASIMKVNYNYIYNQWVI